MWIATDWVEPEPCAEPCEIKQRGGERTRLHGGPEMNERDEFGAHW